MSRRAIILSATVALLSGCAAHRPQIAIAPPSPAPVPVQAAALPAGAYPGMPVPARLADGRYATPNYGLGDDGALWHLRAGLNVAALACRGAQGNAIVAGYNAMLGREKVPLAAAQARYAASFQAGGAGAYDDAMTRLYNFFSQAQVRDAFCATAARVLAESAGIAPEAMPSFARTALTELDQPFNDFYSAYDAWRSGQTAPLPSAVIALASTPAMASGPVTMAPTAPVPRLQIDPSVFAN